MIRTGAFPKERVGHIGEKMITIPIEIDAVARVVHEANSAYCIAIGDPILPSWNDLDESYKNSYRIGIEKVLSGSTPEEQHESWMKERISQEWVYGTQLDRVSKIHPNLVSYNQLPLAQRKKDKLFIAIVNVLTSNDLIKT